MTTPITASAPPPEAPPPSAGSDGVNKEAFLKLLVAQLRHQNPLAPEDGAQFLTQLAGFTQLEQTIGMRQELEGIHQTLLELVPKKDA